MGDLIHDRPSGDIQASRQRICTTFLVTISIIAVPALAASLSRISEIGWQPVMGVHIVLAVMLWGMALMRRSLPYSIQAGFIVLLFCLVGLGGIYQFGQMAGGVAFIVAASPIAVLLFGGRSGLYILLLTYAMASLLAILITSGILPLHIDVSRYAVAPTAWATSLIGWLFASAALTASLYVFNKSLIDA